MKGYDGYRQGLQTSRTAAMSDLSSAARSLLQPAIDRFYHEALQLGLRHRFEQDHAWSDQSSLDTLATNQQEAVLRRNDPARVQALADHGVGEWVKIGERKGWSDEQIDHQIGQSKAQLFGAVIQAQLRDGNVTQAQATLDQAQGQVDPETMRTLMQSIKVQGQSQTFAPNPLLIRSAAAPQGPELPTDQSGPQLAQGNQPATAAPTSTDQDGVTLGDEVPTVDSAGKSGIAPPTDPDASRFYSNHLEGSAPPTDPGISGADPNSVDAPILYKDSDRRKSILRNTPSKIVVSDLPKVASLFSRVVNAVPKTLGEQTWAGIAAVRKYDDLIREEAKREGIDPDLVRAIMYIEESHGWYGVPLEPFGIAKSLMPMNIRPKFWGSLSPDHPDLKDPAANIHAGIVLLKRITERLDSPTIAKIATLYNSLSADSVSDYGRRVAEIYETKPWIRGIPLISPKQEPDQP